MDKFTIYFLALRIVSAYSSPFLEMLFLKVEEFAFISKSALLLIFGDFLICTSDLRVTIDMKTQKT